MSMRKLAAGVALGALAMAASSAVYAQETTSGVRGQITDQAGKPIAGATVTVTNVSTKSVATTLTTGDGSYDVRNLLPGGPYTVEAKAADHESKVVKVDSIGLGAATLNFSLSGGSTEVAAVVVTATSVGGIKEVTTGPVSSFTAHDIEVLPSFSRDLKDIVRLNPFVTLDPSNSNAMIVAGANSRVNTIYFDGVKQADDFGLNANGYPSQRSPYSIEWVKDFNFEIAPYDVQYGEFQGGVLNIVTKDGGNTFHGAVYGEYDGSDFAAKSIQPSNLAPSNGAAVAIKPFYDETYGGWLSGPIIPDKLFFFGGYEKYETAATASSFGPTDSSASFKVNGLDTADLNTIINTLKTVYNFNPLGYDAASLPQTDEKYFIKLNWNITDRQRLMVSYQHVDGITLSNGGTNASGSPTAPTNIGGSLALLSQYYNLDQDLTVYNAQLFSEWTDQFSTELAYNHKVVDSIRAPLAGNKFAQFQIRLDDGTSVFLGPDISSQANILDNTDQLFRVRAHYKIGDHTLTVGYENERLQVFNLFDQNANGAYIFATNTTTTGTTPCYAGQNVFQDLAKGEACSLTYANSASNISANAAANWGDTDNTFYLQDEWAVTPALVLRGGIRAEWYTDATAVAANPVFEAQFNIPNTATFEGRALYMPRFGFNYQPDDSLTVSGGVGLFGGGDPNVWLSNSYTNSGLLIGSASCSITTTVCPAAVQTVNGTSVGSSAQAVNTASANKGTGIVNMIDPNFKLPSTWKASFSIAKQFAIPHMGDDWRVHGDLIWEAVQEGITWTDLYADANQLATAPDGRPTYSNARFSSALLAQHAPYDLELTNDQLGGGVAWAVGFGKQFDDGWSKGLGFDFSYTHENITEANPGTSSVALSNYSQWAVSSRDTPQAAISSYNIKYAYKFTLTYSHAFFGDYKTNFSLFAQRRAGLPFSYTFFSTSSSNSSGGDQMFGEVNSVAVRNTQLLYVPKLDSSGNVTAVSDPLVTYNSTFNIAAFNAFVHQFGLAKYAGEIVPRNAFDAKDVTTADLLIEQEIPAFFPNGARLKLTFTLIDLPNLLNKKWGIDEQIGFPGVYAPVQARNCQANAPTPTTCLAGAGNYYQFDTFRGNPVTSVVTTSAASAWYMKFGLKYQF